jgi:hypothetical protein
VAPPAPPRLPTAGELSDDAEARPTRACPRCCHPLPLDIDHLDVYPISLAGNALSSKTTTIVALITAVERMGAQAIGVPAFAATETTIDYLSSLANDPLATYRTGRRVQGTDPRRHPPFEFRVTLPTNADRGEKPALVLLHDAAGEDLARSDHRAQRAGALQWADAILFVYNPQDAPARRLDTNPNKEQSVLLNALHSDLRRRSGAETPELPPLVIAVSKADLLLPRPDVRFGPAPEHEVIATVRDQLSDASMIDAAQQWPEVYWRFIAPHPEDGESQGVLELFQLLLSLLSR